MAPLPYSNCVFSDGKSNWAVLKHALQDQHWLMQNNPWNKPILYSRSPQLVFYIMLKKNEMQKKYKYVMTNVYLWRTRPISKWFTCSNEYPVTEPLPPSKKN